MTDEELFMVYFQAILDSHIPVEVAAEQASQAVIEHRKRFAYGD